MGVCKLLLIFALFSFANSKILLLKVYKEANFTDAKLQGYLMSEKLDGVRGYWDGKQLFSKSLHPYSPPKYFTKDFPPFMLDGELWFARRSFAKTVSMVRSDDWQKLRYNIFDVPNACEYFHLQKCTLQARLATLQKWLQTHPNKYIKIIKQIKITSKKQLNEYFASLVSKGAEGLVLRKDAASYERKRSKSALKYKPFYDAECVVCGYVAGKGRFEGLMGALLCKARLKGGTKIIKIGSGFSHAQRANPPKIGQTITYKHQAFTKTGLPRFPIFLRVRSDAKL